VQATREGSREPELPADAFRCVRPSKSAFLLLADGKLVPMRCGASNRCPYCAWLIAVENSIVVGMDALWGDQPQIGMTLTTHRPDFDMDRFRQAVAQVFRWLRSEIGRDGIEYLGLIEWSSGKGGKGRMPHMHTLLKGVQASDLGDVVDDPRGKGRRYELELALREKWREWTGGAWVVDARPLRSAGGAVAYMVGHHHKTEQAPPAGVKGTKRMRPSRGYFDGRLAEVRGLGERPVQAYRAAAKEQMRSETARKALLAQLIDADTPPDVIDQALDELLAERASGPRAVPVKVLPDGRLQHLSTGEVYDGEGEAIYREANGA
jgi:hypothetical protein